jgi:hypothetical protein
MAAISPRDVLSAGFNLERFLTDLAAARSTYPDRVKRRPDGMKGTGV